MSEGKKSGNRIRVPVAALIAAAVLGGGWYQYVRYWGPDSWKFGYDEADRGADEDGNPWIGAKDPELVIDEFIDYECPHCPQFHKEMRVAIGDDLDRVRLVRHDYARMPCKTTGGAARRSSCELARAGICAARMGDFWEWNDAVVGEPRPLTGPARKTYTETIARAIGLDPDALKECMHEDATFDRAQEIYRDAKRKRVNETPTYFVNGEKVPVEAVFEVIEDRL